MKKSCNVTDTMVTRLLQRFEVWISIGPSKQKFIRESAKKLTLTVTIFAPAPDDIWKTLQKVVCRLPDIICRNQRYRRKPNDDVFAKSESLFMNNTLRAGEVTKREIVLHLDSVSVKSAPYDHYWRAFISSPFQPAASVGGYVTKVDDWAAASVADATLPYARQRAYHSCS